jgi:hypothetical protein
MSLMGLAAVHEGFLALWLAKATMGAAVYLLHEKYFVVHGSQRRRLEALYLRTCSRTLWVVEMATEMDETEEAWGVWGA